MTTAQYFHVPKMRAMGLRSHDCNEQRVYQHLRYLCRVNGWISSLTTLHLTLQSSEQVLIKVLKYLIPLQELVLSVAHPSPSWQSFLESLAAKPSTNEWPAWCKWMNFNQQWVQWRSYQTWHANVLPQLKYLGIKCPKGFSQSECLDNFPLLRLVGWTRAHLSPPLERLEVWEGKESMDDIAADYISTDYQYKHLGISSSEYDAKVVMGISHDIWSFVNLILHYSYFMPLSSLGSSSILSSSAIPIKKFPFCHTWNKSRSWKFGLESFPYIP
jgi:hypothetical protein